MAFWAASACIWRPRCAVLCGTATLVAVRMLEIRDLSVSYGGLAALSGVSLTVAEGQFVAIVGPNGAGKTTLFKAISGTVTPVSGRTTYKAPALLPPPPGQPAHPATRLLPEGRQALAARPVLKTLEM